MHKLYFWANLRLCLLKYDRLTYLDMCVGECACVLTLRDPEPAACVPLPSGHMWQDSCPYSGSGNTCINVSVVCTYWYTCICLIYMHLPSGRMWSLGELNACRPYPLEVRLRYMAVYGRIWPYMAVYGRIWPYMAVYGHAKLEGKIRMHERMHVCMHLRYVATPHWKHGSTPPVPKKPGLHRGVHDDELHHSIHVCVSLHIRAYVWTRTYICCSGNHNLHRGVLLRSCLILCLST
jgi:hypothetical protein